MLLEALHQAETALKQALAAAQAGGVGSGELRDALVATKTVAGVVTAVQTHLASAVARTERHGDGGTGVLAETTGLTRREARGQVKTAKTIAGVPSVRDAVSQGRVSQANAKRLADAVERTSAGAVGADGDLLKMAESMRADQFSKEARRWIAEQQDDGGEADYQRQRAKRSVRVWDNDNGMVELHGTFDPLTGKRIGNRLRAEADRMFRNDKKRAKQHGSDNLRRSEHERPGGPGAQPDKAPDISDPGAPRDNRTDRPGEQRDQAPDNNGPGSAPNTNNHGTSSRGRQPGNSSAGPRRRTFEQCMADALDNLTSNTLTATTGTEAAGRKSAPPAKATGADANADTDTTGASARTDTATGSRTNTGANAHTDTDSDTGIGQAATSGHTADADTEPTNSHQTTRTGTGSDDMASRCVDTDAGSAQAVGTAGTGSGSGVDADTVTGTVASGAGSDFENSTSTTTGTGDKTGGAVGADGGTCTCRGADDGGGAKNRSGGTGSGRAFADICVMVQVDAATGVLVAQLPDGERLPASVLDKLICDARVSVILANSRGQPIWGAVASRVATERQRRLLLASWGGCFHCAAHPAMCEIHHIVPVARGGETKIDNLIPVCWECHDLIHDNHWKIHKRPDGNHTLHPPQQRHHGPAHAPEQPLLLTHT